MSDRVEVETVSVGHGVGASSWPTSTDHRVPTAAACCSSTAAASCEGDRRQLAGYAIALGRAGYTSLACEYRLAGEALWPAALDDVHTAFGYFHDEAKSLGSPSRSWRCRQLGGGMSSLLLAGTSSLPVAASIAFYAPVDFLGDDARAHGSPEGMKYLLGDDVSDERLRAR